MDVETIQRIRPSLTRYLDEFNGCFVKSASRRHMQTYVTGQLSGLERKSVEPIADAAGVQRQFCGSVGKTENCVISVHLGY